MLRRRPRAPCRGRAPCWRSPHDRASAPAPGPALAVSDEE